MPYIESFQVHDCVLVFTVFNMLIWLLAFHVPSHYLYKRWNSIINCQMPDVIEWVRGMEEVRITGIKLSYLNETTALRQHALRFLKIHVRGLVS